MSKYTEMKEFYEVEIKDLRKAVDYWCSRASELGCEKCMLDGKVEIYEKILSKVLDGPNKHTDAVVIFEGKTYSITGFNLNHTEGEADTLTVDCVRVGLPV
jgi:hypothetical protein